MITLRRAKERHHTLRSKHEEWLTFDSKDRADPLADGFGNLETLDEDLLPPGAVVRGRARHYAETVTYVREGALAYEDSRGRSGVIHAGEFQRMTSRGGIHHSEMNASRTDWAHIFQLGLGPAAARLDPGQEQKRFSAADRRGELCIVASPDARQGSLRIHQDTLIYSALLERGHHVVHELSQGRSAWLHVVHGEVTLGDIVLTAGDGAGVTAERAVSFTARQNTEILLLDLVQQLP
jgi:hypothetical protein